MAADDRDSPLVTIRSGTPWARQASLRLCWRCWDAQPAIEFVEEVLHHRAQFVSDLGLALAVAGALAGIADDEVEHGGERDALEPGDLWRDGGGIADGGGEGSGLPVDSTISSTPVSRRCRFLTICRSKLPSRSRGTSIPTCPVASVSTVFERFPLRTLPVSLTTGPFLSWPRWARDTSSSAARCSAGGSGCAGIRPGHGHPGARPRPGMAHRRNCPHRDRCWSARRGDHPQTTPACGPSGPGVPAQ